MNRARFGGLRLRAGAALAVVSVCLSACVSVTFSPAEPGASPGSSPARSPELSPEPGSPGPSSAVPPSSAPPSTGPATTVPATRATDSPTLPAPTGATRDRPLIGYISYDEALPYARQVTVGIVSEAERLELDLVTCDAGRLAAKALGCGQRLREAGVDGVVSFQPFADLAGEVCTAYGDVPTIAIAIAQEPCQVAIARVDDAAAGRMAGEALGRFARDRWECDITAFVSLEASAAGAAAVARSTGLREGYSSVCPLPEDGTATLDGVDRVATARVAVASLLDRLPGRRLVVAGVNGDATLGALEAARASGREGDLYLAGVGADASVRSQIACNERYVASIALFPENTGTIVLPALLDVLAGSTVSPELALPFELLTGENVRRLFPGTPACED